MTAGADGFIVPLRGWGAVAGDSGCGSVGCGGCCGAGVSGDVDWIIVLLRGRGGLAWSTSRVGFGCAVFHEVCDGGGV